MAANYWLSSHANNHILTRHDLRTAPGRSIDLRYASERELACINIWSCNVIHKLAKKLNCRQIVTATAVTYFRRFYVKNAIADTDFCLVAAACMYVATKVEEAPSHIKTVVEAARSVFSEYPALGPFPNDAAVLAEMEFYLIEDLDFHLIIWHPYRDLAQFTGREDSAVPKDAAEKTSEWVPAVGSPTYDDYRQECDRQASMLDLSDEALQMAWFIINDTYRTDIILLYPPYIIALAAIYITVVLQPHPSLRAIKTLPPPVYQPPNVASSVSTSTSTSSDAQGARTHRQSLTAPQQTVVPLVFFAHFPLSMSLVLELVQEIVTAYELWNRLENPLLPIQRPPHDPLEIPFGLASTRLNQPYNSSPNVHAIRERTESQSASKSADLAAQAKTGDKAADERVVEVLVRMRREREADLGQSL
ncbi:hypothetical protein CROQUDRAFT_654909 [Cronartium quercuum f. sp. fusiforme G11]|uniref:Cyclin-like domain-containing protein n=1 Tax=Cronartium quercuum f. sp. fusiforme G11 TaxID=708437 RepID=A0A9P6TE27_9BASI|nr:hypothetical protein CROQUDRAFT_654909 [Cronartium quercuum f. sp. fusiforme G11]